MKRQLAERPWIWIVVAFVLFVAALAAFVRTAVLNMPETAPLSGRVEHARR